MWIEERTYLFLGLLLRMPCAEMSASWIVAWTKIEAVAERTIAWSRLCRFWTEMSDRNSCIFRFCRRNFWETRWSVYVESELDDASVVYRVHLEVLCLEDDRFVGFVDVRRVDVHVLDVFLVVLSVGTVSNFESKGRDTVGSFVLSVTRSWRSRNCLNRL